MAIEFINKVDVARLERIQKLDLKRRNTTQ